VPRGEAGGAVAGGLASSQARRADPHAPLGLRLLLDTDPWFQPGGLQDPGTDDVAQGQQPDPDERWSSFLPFGRERALAAGVELPLPFGVSATYSYLRRDVEVKSVKAGLNGAELRPVEFAEIESDVQVHNALLRADAWILPMVNAALFYGWTWNETDTAIDATIPRPGPLPDLQRSLVLPTELDGPTYGASVRFAGGYESLFVTGDLNWITVDLGRLSKTEVRVASLRTGLMLDWNGYEPRVYTGVTLWDTDRSMFGSETIAGVGTVDFLVDQAGVTDTSIILGANLPIADRFEFLVEVQHLDDLLFVTTGGFVRF